MRDAETTVEERAALLRAMLSEPLTGPHLEIGTAAGGTLRDLMNAYTGKTRPPFVVVDPLSYFPDQRSVIERNLSAAGLDPETVTFRTTTSAAAFHQAEKSRERFSFIFIDAVHDAQNVMLDLRWCRMLDVGGVVAFHDFNERTFPGVAWSVKRFLSKWRNYQKIEHAGDLLAVRKVAPSIRPEIGNVDIAQAALLDASRRLGKSIRKRTVDRHAAATGPLKQ